MTAPGWNDLEFAKGIHAFFELGGLILFAVLVLFEILAHRHTKRENLFKILALVSFALAIGFELLAYPYSRRVEKLSDDKISELESGLKPKPFNERLRVFCNSVDPNILLGLRNGTNKFHGFFSQSELGELRKFAAEPESVKFMAVQFGNESVVLTDGVRSEATLILNPNVINGLR